MTELASQSCIDACNLCAQACEQCATACLQESDLGVLTRCISLDLDCARLCRLAASCIARESEFAGTVCNLCADACEMCADECDQFALEHCRACAAACRQCADECRRQLAMAPVMRQPGIGAGDSAPLYS